MSESTAFALALPEAAADGFAPIRREARERFLSRGWPTRRNESYKYTDLSALERQDWPRAEKPDAQPELPSALGARSVWVDGYLSGQPGDERLVSLQDCASSPPPALTALLGQLAPQDDPVVALNTTLFDHGAWIDLPTNTAPGKALELVYTNAERDTPAATHARLAVQLGQGSRLVLIERHLGGDADTLSTRVAEISLAAGSQLLHIRLNEAGTGTRLLGHTTVRTGSGARYQCLNLDLGAKLSREAFVVDLVEDHAETALSGLALLDGKRHADADVRVVHDALHTRSRQVFRGVLDGRSHSVYSGLVLVKPGAQKADSDQASANLLLSPKAEADTRPQLEIYADDVICNHGAATGAIDPDALFYLQSRGIDADAARRMIAYGFAAHILADLEDERLHRELLSVLADHMQAPQEVREWL
ncbi:MAG: Fe-S cluster assembly protein SufD [Gammaproteobacteria bacterium]